LIQDKEAARILWHDTRGRCSRGTGGACAWRNDEIGVPLMSADRDILSALESVIDPELGINVVDLGLIYHAMWTKAGIDVAMTTTSPSCPLSDVLLEDVVSALRARFCETSVHVELTFEPPWGPERLSDEARRQLGWLAPLTPGRVLH
jgi:metal-sulfur cluster biosynthetic enzyme